MGKVVFAQIGGGPDIELWDESWAYEVVNNQITNVCKFGDIRPLIVPGTTIGRTKVKAKGEEHAVVLVTTPSGREFFVEPNLQS